MKKRLSILLAICLIAAVTVGCGDSETEAEVESVPEVTAEAEEPTVDAELKAKLDNYETLADGYVEACEDYFSAIEAGKKASKEKKAYESAKEAFNSVDAEIESLEAGLESVDLDYFKEVSTRATEKVAKVLEKHADAVQMLLEMNAN